MDSTILFTFLSIAMVLASFIPMLAYSYIKGLFEEINKGINKGNHHNLNVKNVAESVFNFYYAMDFLVGQSILLVMTSAILGMVVYLSVPNEQILSLEKSFLLLIFIYLIYAFLSLGVSFYLIVRYRKNVWKDIWKFTLWFYILIIFYISFAFYWILKIPDCCIESYKWLISVTSAFLIFWACSWFIPASKYQPLEQIRKIISTFITNNKSKENNNKDS